jgi:uncharacterized protein (TIGR02284 family)
MATHADDLKSLHTTLIDSRNGYDEALQDAEGKGLTDLFRDMIALREHDAEALKTHVIALGEQPNEDGSFLSTVHRAVISVRSLFQDLDERILPGLIDGEERIRGYYDEAIKSSPGGAEQKLLLAQREKLDDVIRGMKARAATARES